MSGAFFECVKHSIQLSEIGVVPTGRDAAIYVYLTVGSRFRGVCITYTALSELAGTPSNLRPDPYGYRLWPA